MEYRGRIAPSPTGYLHLGHALTFWRAEERARAAGGKLLLRIEDIDLARCRPEFTEAIMEDLRWFRLEWDEGPDIGGRFAPYVQSERWPYYLEALKQLRAAAFIYPCICSRKDVLAAATAPHDENEEPLYPGTCRPAMLTTSGAQGSSLLHSAPLPNVGSFRGRDDANGRQDARARDTESRRARETNWRFRVPDGEQISFVDQRLGPQTAIAGKDFGDFIVWRRDDMPAYQLAVTVDDAAMEITEVVRGEDLLLSTFRQLLIYRALGLTPPRFFHAPLIVDENGTRLSKRDASRTLRRLRASGVMPDRLRAQL